MRPGIDGSVTRRVGWVRRVVVPLVVVLVAELVVLAAPVGSPVVPAAEASTLDPFEVLSITDDPPSNRGASPSISYDGNRVVFQWDGQVWLRDRAAGTTVLVSKAPGGDPANASGHTPVISGDGSTVAFNSRATNLVAGVDGSVTQIFAVEVASGAVDLVSASASGDPGDRDSFGKSLSGDGSRVVISSLARNLTDPAPGSKLHVYVKDRASGEVSWVSRHRPPELETLYGKGFSKAGIGAQAISGDGSLVVFHGEMLQGSVSPSCNSGNPESGPFLYDVDAGEVHRLFLMQTSPKKRLAPFDRCGTSPAISGDGSTIVFRTSRTGGHSSERAGFGITTPSAAGEALLEISVTGGEVPDSSLSDPILSYAGDRIGFRTAASNVATSPVAGGGLNHAYVVDRGGLSAVSLTPSGDPSAWSTGQPFLSAAGDYVVLETKALDLVDPPLSQAQDRVFGRGLAPSPGCPALLTAMNPGLCSSPWWPWLPLVADPVSTDSGAFVHARSDVEVAALSLDRVYSSMPVEPAGVDRSFGPGWASGFSARALSEPGVDPADSDVLVLWGDGRAARYENAGSGVWAQPPGMVGVLSLDAGGYVLAERDGRVLRFDGSGRLVALEDPSGVVVSVSWDETSGLLASVSSSEGPGLVFHDDEPNARVDRVETSDGRVVGYTYDPHGVLVEVSAPGEGVPGPVGESYEVTPVGRLISEIRDGEDNVVVRNRYGPFGRVVEQETPDGDTISFSYREPSGVGEHATRVTWDDGVSDPSVIVYHFDALDRVVYIEDPQTPPGAVSRGWHDGRPTHVTDRGGATSQEVYLEDRRLRMRLLPDPDTGAVAAATHPPDPGTQGGDFEFFWYWDEAPGSPGEPGDTRVWRHRNAAGEITEFAYTGEHRTPSEVTRAAGTADAATTQVVVGADSRVREVLDPDGVSTRYHYGDEDPSYGGCETYQLCATRDGTGTDEITTSYTYDSAGRVASITRAAGTTLEATTTFDYDPAGRLVKETGPLVGVVAGHHPRELRYDLAGRLVCVSDESNPVDAGSCDASNASAFFTYDAAGRVLSEQDADGNVTVHEYVSAALERTTVASGTDDAAVTERHLGPLGRLEAVVDPTGVVSQWCYDTNGNVTAVVEGLVSTGSVCGDVSGLRASVSEFDLRGRRVAEVDATGLRTEFRYDAADRLTHVVEAAGTSAESVTETVYDGAGRVWRTLVPPPNVASFDWWDPASDGDKLVTERSYTPGGRLEELSSPGPNSGYWESNPLAGCCPEFAWAEVVTTRYGYDDAGRLEEVWSPLAVADPGYGPTTYGYDAAGGVREVVSPEGRRVVYHRDAVGRVDHVQRSAGDGGWSVTSFEHDPLGRVTGESMPYATLGSPPQGLGWKSFEYRANGWLEAVVDPLGGRAEYGYDHRGNRVRREAFDPDPGPFGADVVVDRWAYDLADRLVAQWREPVADPQSQAHLITFSYENPATQAVDGLLWAVHDGSDRVTSYTYDPAERLVAESFEDLGAAESFTRGFDHDPAGRVIEIVDSRDPTSPWTQSFDVVGNLTSVSWAGETIGWSYGATGEVTARHRDGTEKLLYDLDGNLAWSYADLGWLVLNIGSWHRDTDGLVLQDNYFELHWAGADPPIDYWGRTYWRDHAGLVHFYGQVSFDVASFDPVQVILTSLQRDPGGQITTENFGIAEPDGQGGWAGTSSFSHTYTYDPAGQLTEIYDNGAEAVVASYVYDTHGRRRAHTTAEGVTGYSWDDLGRLERLEHPTGPDTTYSYDPAGRRAAQVHGDIGVDYTYGPDGRLSARHGTDDTTPTWSETRGYDPAANLATVTLEDHTTQDTVVGTLRWDPTGGVTQLWGWDHDNGTTTIAHYLQQGPNRVPRADNLTGPAVIDVHGSHYDLWGANFDHTTAAATAYDAFGNPTTSGDQHAHLGYRGEVHTGDLIHLRNRDYDPTTGTFTTPDPLDGVDGTPVVANPYHYADNNPLNKIDPLGLRPVECGSGGLGGAGGGGGGSYGSQTASSGAECFEPVEPELHAGVVAPTVTPVLPWLVAGGAAAAAALGAALAGGSGMHEALAHYLFPQLLDPSTAPNGLALTPVKNPDCSAEGLGDTALVAAGAMMLALGTAESKVAPDGTVGTTGSGSTTAVALYCIDGEAGSALGRKGSGSAIPAGFAADLWPSYGPRPSNAGHAETNILTTITNRVRPSEFSRGFVLMMVNNKVCGFCRFYMKEWTGHFKNITILVGSTSGEVLSYSKGEQRSL